MRDGLDRRAAKRRPRVTGQGFGPLVSGAAVVLMMELTGQARAAIVPMPLAVALATLVARTIEPRSIYDARLTDAEVAKRQQTRDPVPS